MTVKAIAKITFNKEFGKDGIIEGIEFQGEDFKDLKTQAENYAKDYYASSGLDGFNGIKVEFGNKVGFIESAVDFIGNL